MQCPQYCQPQVLRFLISLFLFREVEKVLMRAKKTKGGGGEKLLMPLKITLKKVLTFKTAMLFSISIHLDSVEQTLGL